MVARRSRPSVRSVRLIAASEGRKQEQINIAMGQKEAAIAKSEGDKISDINQAQGEVAADSRQGRSECRGYPQDRDWQIGSEGGLQAVNLKVAGEYVAALSNIARTGNTHRGAAEPDRHRWSGDHRHQRTQSTAKK